MDGLYNEPQKLTPVKKRRVEKKGIYYPKRTQSAIEYLLNTKNNDLESLQTYDSPK